MDDYEVVAEELSQLAEKMRGLEERLAEVRAVLRRTQTSFMRPQACRYRDAPPSSSHSSTAWASVEIASAFKQADSLGLLLAGAERTFVGTVRHYRLEVVSAAARKVRGGKRLPVEPRRRVLGARDSSCHPFGHIGRWLSLARRRGRRTHGSYPVCDPRLKRKGQSARDRARCRRRHVDGRSAHIARKR
jgi:hypothetical protein